MSPIRWRGWLVAALIFALGLAVGSAGTALWGVRYLRRALQASTQTSGPADRAAARIGAELKAELALTPEEAERVQAILNESAGNLKSVRARAALQAGAELRAATRRIAAALPPEKQAGLHRIIARRYQRLGLTPPKALEETAP